jgi:hypothetical protein
MPLKLLLFFIDGLGLGEDTDQNPARGFLNGIADLPFVRSSTPAEFPHGILMSADATGGIPGLPQSATGQATLMTGVNTPALLGYHLTALPNQALVDLVREWGIMKLLSDNGVRVTASNLYTPEFFSHRESLEKRRGRNSLPVSALTIRGAGVPFRFPADYNRGRALFADLTNRLLRERGYDIAAIDPPEAAGRMEGILQEADFVFHEYFATDTYAHKKKTEELGQALEEINLFLRTLMTLTDPEQTAILVISDHGNCEDSTSADHTVNPVPVLLLSRSEKARAAFRGITRLQDVHARILAFFGLQPHDDEYSGGGKP